jgi:hypothetical protein
MIDANTYIVQGLPPSFRPSATEWPDKSNVSLLKSHALRELIGSTSEQCENCHQDSVEMVRSAYVCIYDAVIPLCKDPTTPQQASRVYRHNAHQSTRRKHQRQYMVFGSAARILRVHLAAKQETRRGDCQHWSWSQERQCENPQCSAFVYSGPGTRNARI